MYSYLHCIHSITYLFFPSFLPSSDLLILSVSFNSYFPSLFWALLDHSCFARQFFTMSPWAIHWFCTIQIWQLIVLIYCIYFRCFLFVFPNIVLISNQCAYVCINWNILPCVCSRVNVCMYAFIYLCIYFSFLMTSSSRIWQFIFHFTVFHINRVFSQMFMV